MASKMSFITIYLNQSPGKIDIEYDFISFFSLLMQSRLQSILKMVMTLEESRRLGLLNAPWFQWTNGLLKKIMIFLILYHIVYILADILGIPMDTWIFKFNVLESFTVIFLDVQIDSDLVSGTPEGISFKCNCSGFRSFVDHMLTMK